MGALEGDHVGDEPVLAVQLVVLRGGDRGLGVPAEGLQGLPYEFVGFGRAQAALALEAQDQRPGPRAEDIAPGEEAGRQLAQGRVVDQFQAQQ
ncbi:hypothetical protein D3C84_667210 [compost metagenome]